MVRKALKYVKKQHVHTFVCLRTTQLNTENRGDEKFEAQKTCYD